MTDGFVSGRAEIHRFLLDLKSVLDGPRFDRTRDFYLADRRKNRETLGHLNFGQRDVVSVLRSLALEDYVETVPDDRQRESAPYFVFAKEIEGIEIYMKIKIALRARPIVFCLSFHATERTMIRQRPYGTQKH